MKSIRMNSLTVGNNERVLRYTGRVNYGDVVNVGTIGHVDWGRHGYQPDMKDISWSTPHISISHYRNRWVDYDHLEMIGLYRHYLDKILEGHTEETAIKETFSKCRKLKEPYLGFDNGGLVVADRVIWILADKEYRRFHKKAAEWVLPPKEYVKVVVARYFGKGDET